MRREVSDRVANLAVESRRVRDGDEGHGPRRAPDRQRLGRRQRPPRARADPRHPLREVARQNALPDEARRRIRRRRRQIDPRQRVPQLALRVTLGVGDDRRVVDRRIVVEAHADECLPVIGRKLEPNRRVGAGLHQDPPQLLGVLGDAAGLLPREGDPQEQVGDRPGVGDAGLRAQVVGHPAELTQDDRLVEISAHADEEHGRRAPLPRLDANPWRQRRRLQHQRRRQPQDPGQARRARGDHRCRVAGAASEQRDGGGGQRGGRPHPAHARHRHQHERRGRGGCRRQRPADTPPAQREARPSDGHQHEEDPRRRECGRQQPRPVVARVGPKRPRFQRARGRHDRQAGVLDGRRQRRLASFPVVDVDQEPDPAAVFGQEPAQRVGAAHDALPRLLVLALFLGRRAGQRSDRAWPARDSPQVDDRAAPAPQHALGAGFAAGVDGDVQQPSRAEHRAHARDRRQPLLGQLDGVSVGGVVDVVDLDLHLGQRRNPETRAGFAPAADGGRPRRRPRERIGRGLRRARGRQAQRDGGRRREVRQLGAIHPRKVPPAGWWTLIE